MSDNYLKSGAKFKVAKEGLNHIFENCRQGRKWDSYDLYKYCYDLKEKIDATKESRLLDVHDLSDMFKIDKETLYRFIRSGIGPKFIRFSKKTIRFQHKDVEEWFESRERSG